jgi:hypothetical protein
LGASQAEICRDRLAEEWREGVPRHADHRKVGSVIGRGRGRIREDPTHNESMKPIQEKKKTRPAGETGLMMGRACAFPLKGLRGGEPRQKRIVGREWMVRKNAEGDRAGRSELARLWRSEGGRRAGGGRRRKVRRVIKKGERKSG